VGEIESQQPAKIGRTIEPKAERDAPERVEEQRVAGRTLKTAWGEYLTTRMSSGEKVWDGCLKTSWLMKFAMEDRSEAGYRFRGRFEMDRGSSGGWHGIIIPAE